MPLNVVGQFSLIIIAWHVCDNHVWHCCCTVVCCTLLQVFAFFADHRVTLHRPSRRCRLVPYRRQATDRRPASWHVRLAVRDLQPSGRLPPPMTVPGQRTRRFRCVFDLRRCRRHLVPSSLTDSSPGDSRAPSRLLGDVEDFDAAAVDHGQSSLRGPSSQLGDVVDHVEFSDEATVRQRPIIDCSQRGPSRLLVDVEDFDDVTVDQAPPDTGPLIVVKHFCKV